MQKIGQIETELQTLIHCDGENKCIYAAPSRSCSLHAPCDLFRAALGHAVVAVFVQIILHAGVSSQGHDVCLVGGVAKGHHVGQLQRFFDAQQLGEGGLVDGTHDAAAQNDGIPFIIDVSYPFSFIIR